MLSARVRDQLRGTLGVRGKASSLTSRLKTSSSRLQLAFGVSLAAYLAVKLIGVVVALPPQIDLVAVPAGLCALGLALSARVAKTGEQSLEEEQEAFRPGLAAGAVLVVFTVVYLAVNTVPMITSQDESAIVLGGRTLATEGSLEATSALNDQYNTNIIGALHVMYRTPTEMYYRTFPGMALLYAPFSLLPGDLGYRFFVATFGVLTIASLYLVAWRLLRSWQGGLAAALVFAVSPAFGHWAISVFNNVPVLALELSAVAVVLWAPRERAWMFGLAGALMSVAFFARMTEFAYVVPVLALVIWRTRASRPVLAFGGASLAGIVLIAGTNLIFYGDALFLPHVGTAYISLPAASDIPVQLPTSSPQDLLGRYADFSIGGDAPTSASGWLGKLRNEWFHVRYLASSTFAFPFLSLAFIGLAWRTVAGRRNGWLLVGLLLVAAVATLGIYGQGDHNYYGYGQGVVRASFVRYALPVYAALAVAVGAFLLDASRVLRWAAPGWLLSAMLLGLVATVGVAHSYDADVYGFNRVNAFRESDRASWQTLRSFLDERPVRPLVIGGPSVEKLVDSTYEDYFINYDSVPPHVRIPLLESAAEQAGEDRDVYVITSTSNSVDKELLIYLYTWFTPKRVLRTHAFDLTLWRTAPAHYELFAIDVWNTYRAFDRWIVTDPGLLVASSDNSYVQTAYIDNDGDDRVDRDVLIAFEFLDNGPDEVTITGLDSRVVWEPVVLSRTELGQTGLWRTVTVVLKKGEYLQKQLIVSEGTVLRSVKLVGVGPE